MFIPLKRESNFNFEYLKKYSMKILKYLIILCGLIVIRVSHAGGFFEVGQVTLTDTIDGGFWATITPTKTYVNPVVIAGPITANNDLSLFPRVNGLQVGMQSPCQSLGTAAAGVVCPPAGGFEPETITYMIVEEGTWEFPDETEIEADIHNTSTVRSSGVNNSNFDLITVKRDSFDSVPAVLHSVSSFNDTEFIASSVVGTTGNASAVTTTQFNLALEGMEAVTIHGSEDITWVAIEPATGTNAGTTYNTGFTPGLDIDRREVACTSLGHGNSVFVAQHNTMNGGNGSGVRLCAAPDSVFMDEDQVNDAERTGIPERVAWFAYDAGQVGNLVFLTATQTVTDNNGGLAVPNDTLTYTVTITNELNDFDQVDNATDEMTITLPPNTTLVGGSLTASSGTLTGAGPLAWNGSVAPNQVITLTYQVTIDEVLAVCDTDLDNQATLHMDPNWDGANSIDELSDDPTRDDGSDTDWDLGTDDDDPTRIHVDCAALQLVKEVVNDNGGTATVTDFNLATSAGSPLTFTTGTPVGDTTPYTSNQLIVPIGTYTLVEDDFLGYAEGAWSCNGGSSVVTTFDAGSITLASGEEVICTITNDDIAGELTLLKVVNNSPGGGTATAGDWTLEANLGGGAAEVSGTSSVSASVNAGDYVLSEINGPSGYTQTDLSCDAGTLTTDTLTIGLAETITCTFTNQNLITDLQVTKSVNDPNPSVGDIVTFTLNVTNNGPDDATNVVVDDTVLAGFGFVAGSMTGGDARNQAPPGLVWSIISLPAGAANAVTLTYQATVNTP